MNEELKMIVENKGGPDYTQHHIKAYNKDITRYCFIPGDHVRGKKIAEQMDNPVLLSGTRGIFVYSGTYKGIPMNVCSTGMGGPQVAIAMEELANMGVDTFIRVGSCGAMQDDMGVGDVVIATATNREGGTSYNYLPGSFPAVADFFVTRELYDVAQELGLKIHIGVATAGDAFYAPKDPEKRALLKKAGVLCGEMESDTAFILGNYHGWRTGALFVSDGGPKAKEIKSRGKTEINIANHATDKEFLRGEDNIIKIALEAMYRIALKDKE
jgi:DeoD family purine-nucleoside phosphorylase